MAREKPSTEQRRQVRERAKGICEYCQSQEDFATESFSVEHIIPVALGGKTVLENLALACQGCNSHKYIKSSAIDPAVDKVVGLFHPRQSTWTEHFQWSNDFLEIIGITSTGRATIAALKLNRQRLVNLRRAVYSIGEHPPK